MQLLKLVSGKPSCLLDLRFFDPQKNVYVMPNCGAAPTWFAARSEDPAENLAQVRIVPSIAKYAGGGAHVEFVFEAGKLTLARLTRSPNGYQMAIA
jgi:L-fucose isomerase